MFGQWVGERVSPEVLFRHASCISVQMFYVEFIASSFLFYKSKLVGSWYLHFNDQYSKKASSLDFILEPEFAFYQRSLAFYFNHFYIFFKIVYSFKCFDRLTINAQKYVWPWAIYGLLPSCYQYKVSYSMMPGWNERAAFIWFVVLG